MLDNAAPFSYAVAPPSGGAILQQLATIRQEIAQWGHDTKPLFQVGLALLRRLHTLATDAIAQQDPALALQICALGRAVASHFPSNPKGMRAAVPAVAQNLDVRLWPIIQLDRLCLLQWCQWEVERCDDPHVWLQFLPMFAPLEGDSLDQAVLDPLLDVASDNHWPPAIRAAMLRDFLQWLPARQPEHGALHARCLKAILMQGDPVMRAGLFHWYERWHPFDTPSDKTPLFFQQVSHLQKPEHRPTAHTAKMMNRAPSPGPSTNWTVWRELCRVLAAQMAPVIVSFQGSKQSLSHNGQFDTLIVHALLRLSDPDGSDDATAIDHLFELLGELVQAIDPGHRPDFLRRVRGACVTWIHQATRARPPQPAPPPPVHLLALQGALHALCTGRRGQAATPPRQRASREVLVFAQLFRALHAPDPEQRWAELTTLRTNIDVDALLSPYPLEVAIALQGLLAQYLDS